MIGSICSSRVVVALIQLFLKMRGDSLVKEENITSASES